MIYLSYHQQRPTSVLPPVSAGAGRPVDVQTPGLNEAEAVSLPSHRRSPSILTEPELTTDESIVAASGSSLSIGSQISDRSLVNICASSDSNATSLSSCDANVEDVVRITLPWMPPYYCRDWVRGHCQRGNECRRLHKTPPNFKHPLQVSNLMNNIVRC